MVRIYLNQESTKVAILSFSCFPVGWLYLKLGKPLSLGLMDVDAGMRLYELKQGYYAAAISLGSDPSNVIKLINLGNGSTHELRLDPYFNEFQIDPSQGLVVLVAVMGTRCVLWYLFANTQS